MLCPRCQRDNDADAKCCEGCGAKLELACGSCNTPNALNSKFCRECGARLAAPIVGRPAAFGPLRDTIVPPHLAERFRQGHADHLSGPAGERKIITALFADIKGSMALLDGMDPEQVGQVIEPALRLMMNAVYRFEGYVAQTLGDGIFALFGAPIAHEDHARRALYAALSMHDQMRAYSAHLQREQGLAAMQIRIGINTGEVVIRSAGGEGQMPDYVPVFHSTGMAARIQAIAAPGSTFLSEHTQKLTEGFFEFRSIGAVPMKGVSENVKLFELQGIGPLRTRLEVSARHGLSRFVGRKHELESMQLIWQSVCSGHGQILDVVGDAGVGKSRLCHEFKQMVKSDCLILECASDSYGKAFPFLPLIDLLKTYLHIAPGDDDRTILEKTTGRVLALDRALDDIIPFLLSLFGVSDPNTPINRMDPQIRRRRTFDAILRLVLRETQKQTVLMLIEDLHWLDDETQAFLIAFSRTIGGSRLLLMANYRPDYHPQWDVAAKHSQIRLKAFGADEAYELLAMLLGRGAALDSLKRLIIEKTEGNPFFIEEYVKALFEHGVLVRGATISLAKPLSAVVIPATVQGLLAARIDRLPRDQKALLQSLTVLGHASELRLIERATGSVPGELQKLLGQLSNADFIFERPAFPDLEYVFNHALIRETVYGQLLAPDRRRLHSQAAEAIEAHYGDRLGERCTELAHHYTRSNNPSKAMDFLQRAGSQAMQRSAYPAAIEHLSEAISMIPALPDPAARGARELQLQAMIGSAWMATRGFGVAEAERAYGRARELCDEETRTSDLVRVYGGLGLLYVNRGDLDEARTLGRQMVTVGERRQDPDLLVTSHQILGLALLRMGEISNARQHLTTAVAMSDAAREGLLRDSLGADPAVICRGFDAVALWLSGFPEQAAIQSAEAMKIAQTLQPRHPFSLAYALTSATWLHALRRDVASALEQAAATALFATEQGFPSWLSHSLVVQGWAQAEQGDIENGLASIERALRIYAETGAKVWQPWFLWLHAQALSRAGKQDLALETISSALAVARQLGPYWLEAELLRVQGELMLDAESARPAEARIRDARIRFEQSLQISRNQGAKAFELRACSSLGRLAIRQERLRPTVKAELAAQLGWFTEGSDALDLQEARALLAELC
jgi:class 3 adenylate cyclase/predicted ATPase